MLLEWPQSSFIETLSASEYIVSQITRSASRKKSNEGGLCLHLVDLMLAVGAENDRLSVLVGEPVAVAVVRMVLRHRLDAQSTRGNFLSGFHLDELDVRAQPVERHRERYFLLLAAKRLFGLGMTGVDDDAGIWVERGSEEREPHDMVPVQMRLEEIVRPFVARRAAPKRVQPEFP